MNKLRNIINKVTEYLAVFILAFMTLLVTWQVITRFVLKSPSTITEALAKYLFVWLVLITAAYVLGKREHMAIEFFIGKLKQRTQLICNLITEVVIFAFASIVMTYGGGYIALNAALGIPVGIVYLALPVAGVLAMFYSVCNMTDIVKKFKEVKEETK